MTSAGVRVHRRAVTSSALLTGAMIGVIAAIGSTLVVLAQQIPALEGPTDWFLRIVGNPLPWLLLVVVILALPRIRSRSSPVPEND
jgi:hypothetical protein